MGVPTGDDDASGEYWNFILMSTSFGFAHSAITVCIAYATSILDTTLGDASDGTVYLTYTFSALLFATTIVESLGPKNSLVVGILLYVGYLICYMLANVSVIEDSLSGEWTVIMIGALLGGFASGFLWPAQGLYFTASAARYAKAAGIEVVEANDMFAGLFACIYVGSQCLLQLFSALVLEFTDWTDVDLFGVFAIITVIAAIAVGFIKDLKLPESANKGKALQERASEVMKISLFNPRIVVLMPINIAFGFSSAFMSSYMDERTVSDHLNSYAVGYAGIIQTGTVAILSVPLSFVAKYYGKASVMALGAAAYMILSSMYFGYNNGQLGRWSVVPGLYVLYGIARCTWENTVKALYADLFQGPDAPAAFANIYFISGLAGSIYYFIISSLIRVELAALIFVPAALILPGYLTAKAIPSEV